jgi:hypothetical protein
MEHHGPHGGAIVHLQLEANLSGQGNESSAGNINGSGESCTTPRKNQTGSTLCRLFMALRQNLFVLFLCSA